MTEETETYEPRLNSNCVYCDHRADCPAYKDALKGKRDFLATDTEDLEDVAKERESVTRIVKVLDARKKELEGILKTHLKQKDELVLNNVRYRMFNTAKTNHPLGGTLSILERFGIARDEALSRIAGVDNKALESLLKALAKERDKSQITLLKAELGAVAEKTFSPKFWAKEVKP